jgi:hypothetical protein
MTEPADDPPAQPRSTTEALAALVERRKAALAQTAKSGPRGGSREPERAAAARSASKSKPAMRK